MFFTHLNAVWRFRHFWMSLVRMDLRTRYRRSVLGVGWSVLNPILMAVVLVLGFGRILSHNLNMADYGAFLLPGLCTWDFLRTSTVSGCDALVVNEAYIRQCPLPYGIYPLRTVVSTGVHYLITIGVTVVINCFLFGYGTDRAWWLPLEHLWCLPLILVIFFTFAWGGATVCAFATAYFPDVKHLLEVTTTLLFFLTPIMIPVERLGGVIADVTPYNPAFHFLELIRHPLYYGSVPPLELWGLCAGIAAVMFVAGAACIRLLAGKVIFQL